MERRSMLFLSSSIEERIKGEESIPLADTN
jgi:hypothetical protein